MAQFDVIVSFSLILNLLLVLNVFYSYNIKDVIPGYLETKKFRTKLSLELNNVKKNF